MLRPGRPGEMLESSPPSIAADGVCQTCLIVWSLSQMERCLQHPSAWCFLLVTAGAALTIFLETAPTQPTQAAPSTPVGKAYVETIPGSSVQFTMLPIPEGTYLMGSPPSESGRSADEGPQHPV